MSYRKRRIPPGFNFLDGNQTALLQKKVRHAQNLINKAGYIRVMPATLDYPETFEGAARNNFSLRDNQGEDLLLRNDVTIQVIKGFANQLENIDRENIKFYYTVPVFRDEEKYPFFREVYQVGAEYIGKKSSESIVELISLSKKILDDSFKVKSNFVIADATIFQTVERYFENDDLREIMRKKDAPSFAEILREHGLSKSLSEDFSLHMLYSTLVNETDQFNNILKLKKGFSEKLSEFFSELEKKLKGLQKYYKSLRVQNIPIRAEALSIRKTRYYTGFIFEGYVEGLTDPPVRGGAYDQLISDYSNLDLPASGFALDASLLLIKP